jgi:hypothetical protein
VRQLRNERINDDIAKIVSQYILLHHNNMLPGAVEVAAPNIERNL